MSAVIHARVTEQLLRLRLRYVAERLDAVLNDAARTEPTYLDFLDSVLRQEVEAKQRTRVTMALNDRQLRSLARDLARAARSRGLDLRSRPPVHKRVWRGLKALVSK